MKCIIFDLDNTLYDWVNFFSESFSGMVECLSNQLNVPQSILYNEFKILHQKYSSIERPYTIFELPSVKRIYGDQTAEKYLELLDEPLHVFNSIRKRTLKLYPMVYETLKLLRSRGIVIFAYTESTSINACFRLKKLGVEELFTRIYSSESNSIQYKGLGHDKSEYLGENRYIELDKNMTKPNADVLNSILKNEGFEVSEVCYVGDSLSKDVYMAKSANITSVWAEYGTKVEKKHWEVLVKVTHWSPEDVKREEHNKIVARGVEPDYVLQKFDDILNLI